MSTLGIFTVKELALHEGRYYTYGGFGSYLAEIRKYFDRTILVAHVGARPPGKGWYEIPQDNLEVVGLPVTHGEWAVLLASPVTFWRCWRAAARMDVAHARMPDLTGILGAVVCRIRGIPCFHQVIDDWHDLARSIPPWKKHGLGIPLKAWLYTYDWLERRVCRGQLVFAQGKSCFAKHAPHADAVFTISSAHHVDEVTEPRPRFTQPPYTILNVGRLVATKNQELILRALAKLNAPTAAWRFLHVGEGHRREKLAALAAQLGVAPWVEFAGQRAYGPELWAQYARADVFVLSSRSEGTPKAVLEALARGVPVVASAVSGVPSIVPDGVRGLLFPDNDVDGLVAALERLRTEGDLRKRCQRHGHDFALEHTIEQQTAAAMTRVARRWPQLSLRAVALAVPTTNQAGPQD